MTTLALSLSRSPSVALATLMVVLSSICFGVVPLFARELQAAGLGSATISLVRYSVVCLVFLSFLPRSRRKWAEASLMFGAGIAMSFGWIFYLDALKVAPIAAAGVVYMTYPLFTVILAWLIVGQKPGLRSLASCGLILLAAWLALSPSGLSASAVTALIRALPAPISFAMIIVLISSFLRRLSTTERISALSLGAVIGVAPFSAVEISQAPILLTPELVVLALGMAVMTAILPQIVYNHAAPFVGPSKSAAAGAIELPTMFAVGWIGFGEALEPMTLVAGALVLAAILMAPSVRAK